MNTRIGWRGLSPPLVTLAAFFILFLSMDRALNIYDEGIILTDAMRMFNGQVVHRDFYSIYGPGSYAAVAGLFALLGPSFVLARFFGLAVAAGIIGLCFLILRDRTRNWISFAVPCLILVWLARFQSYLYPLYPPLLLALASAVVLLKPGAYRRKPSLLLAGACSGCAAYFRYDAGFALLVVQTGAVWISSLASRPTRRNYKIPLYASCMLAAGAGIAFLPGAALYLATSPLEAFKADIVDFPLQYYSKTRSLPFPRPQELVNFVNWSIYLPLLIVLASIPLTRRELAERHSAEAKREEISPTLLMGLMTLVFYYKGTVRVSPLHVTMSLVPAMVLLGLVIERWSAARRNFMVAALVTVALCPIGAAARMIASDLRNNRSHLMVRELAADSGLVRRLQDLEADCPAWSGVRWAWISPDYARTAHFVASFTPPDEKIFVGLDRDDKSFANAIGLYFAANRLPATHWAQFDPGLQNSMRVQQMMIDELERGRTRLIVRDASFDAENEPNESSKSSGVRLFDNYLAAHYHPIARSGLVAIWARNDADPLPGSPAGGECGMSSALAA